MKSLTPKQRFDRTITEDGVVEAIRALLRLNGAKVFQVVERIPWGVKTSEKGIPDLFCWWPKSSHYSMYGTCWIEVKKPGRKLRPAQMEWIKNAQQDGIIAFKAESVEEMVVEFKKRGIEVKGL